jgi:hypothetical protein
MNAQRKIESESLFKTCLHCEADFIAQRITKKYCSNNCKQMAYFKRNSFTQPILKDEELHYNQNAIAFLKVIKGGLFPPSKLDNLIETFWLFCHAALWNTETFSETETEEFKKLIAEYFIHCKNPDDKFKELVERVCLVKRYVQRRNGRYISKPIDWLNINYVNGLASTKKWFISVVFQRLKVPHYNEGIALLAKAVLKYSESRNILDMLYYRKELIKQKQTDLLQIYMNAIMHMQYFNF